MSELMPDERLAEIKKAFEDEVALHSMLGHGDLSRGWKRRVKELIAEVERLREMVKELKEQASEYARLADIGEASRKDQVEQNDLLQAENERLREIWQRARRMHRGDYLIETLAAEALYKTERPDVTECELLDTLNVWMQREIYRNPHHHDEDELFRHTRRLLGFELPPLTTTGKALYVKEVWNRLQALLKKSLTRKKETASETSL